MANNNYTFMSDVRGVLTNKSGSVYSDEFLDGVMPSMVIFVKFITIFPIWISNTIFNIIYVIGIISNCALLLYIIYFKRYKSPVFSVILSLGVADLGVCVGGFLLFSLVSPFVQEPLWLCEVTFALVSVSLVTSNFHIVMFAILRFIQLIYPLACHAKLTTGLMRKICLAIWVFNSMQIFISVYGYEPLNISTKAAAPMYMCMNIGSRVYVICIIIFWLVLPFIITCDFHVAKQVKFVLSRSVTAKLQDERVQNVRKQTDSRALALTIVTYLVTMIPFIVQSFRVFVLNIATNYIEIYLAEISVQITYSNSAINPWIYLFAAESVRSDVRKMLSCKR